MEQWIVNLLAQAPIVAVFIWFVLEMDDRHSKELARRDEAWRQFIADQRVATVTAMTEVAGELRTVAKHINELSVIVIRHDESTEQFMDTYRWNHPDQKISHTGKDNNTNR